MPTSIKRLLWSLATLVLISGLIFGGWKAYRHFFQSESKTMWRHPDRLLRPESPDRRTYTTLRERAKAAYDLAKRRGLRTDFCLFIDYSIPSGTPRLFVWSFPQGKVVDRAYVMHGVGGGSTASKPVFSNRFGSRCSALGRFQVTHRPGSKLRQSFRVHGIDTDNKTSFDRGILIHSARHVDRHIGKKYIPLDAISCEGCVTVSRKAMPDLDRLIRGSQKCLLLRSFAS